MAGLKVAGRIIADHDAGDAVGKADKGEIDPIPTKTMEMTPLTRRANRVRACWKCTPMVTVF